MKKFLMENIIFCAVHDKVSHSKPFKLTTLSIIRKMRKRTIFLIFFSLYAFYGLTQKICSFNESNLFQNIHFPIRKTLSIPLRSEIVVFIIEPF